MFHYAHSYAASAMKLAEVKIATSHSDAPIRFLFSHAIELYLKAYLLLQGITVGELRSRALGHNLKKLTSKAVTLGLAVPTEHRQSMVLANENEANLDRYIKTGSRSVLLPEGLSEICSNLHEQIGQAVYKSAGLTRRPKPYRSI